MIIGNIDDVNNIYDSFIESFKSSVNRNTSVKEIKLKNNPSLITYMSNELIIKIKEKD
jgi:hypothetical protein